MTRPPSPKRGKLAPAAAKLRGEPFAVSLKLPRDLVAEIDAIAMEESRNRVKMIEYVLRQFVQDYRREAAA